MKLTIEVVDGHIQVQSEGTDEQISNMLYSLMVGQPPFAMQMKAMAEAALEVVAEQHKECGCDHCKGECKKEEE
jgi:acylphosphatase